jgi:DNA-binding XRE family transcriptional regulator
VFNRAPLQARKEGTASDPADPEWSSPDARRHDFWKNVTHCRCNLSYASGYRAAMKKRGAKEDIRERFGFAVKLRREELSLTQEDLAGKAGIHRTYLSDIERGSRNVSLINIERLAAALSLSLSELFQLVERS